MASELICICNNLEKIDEFYSIKEFKRFQQYIDNLIQNKDLIEVYVEEKYAGFIEQWYECPKCKKKWRLVHPDFPFKGIWDIVK